MNLSGKKQENRAKNEAVGREMLKVEVMRNKKENCWKCSKNTEILDNETFFIDCKPLCFVTMLHSLRTTSVQFFSHTCQIYSFYMSKSIFDILLSVSS